MPATERAALFERTLTNVSTVCVGQQARELHQFCSSEAKLLVKFPECDASCRALAEPHLTQPTR